MYARLPHPGQRCCDTLFRHNGKTANGCSTKANSLCKILHAQRKTNVHVLGKLVLATLTVIQVLHAGPRERLAFKLMYTLPMFLVAICAAEAPFRVLTISAFALLPHMST